MGSRNERSSSPRCVSATVFGNLSVPW
jgi:hypothetical protein